MTIASLSHPRALGALALLTSLASLGLGAACTLPVDGLGSGGATGSTTASTGTGGTGGGMECMPNMSKPCYSGKLGTENVGICKSGTSTCKDGSWGSCDGEVTPKAAEDCATKTQDDNCDGQVNEDCPCDPATDKPLACMTGMKGVCAAGTQTCDPGTKSYGACTETTKASFDDCFTPAIDEDCNGTTFGCNGMVLGAKSTGMMGEDQVFAVAVDGAQNLAIGGETNGKGPGYDPMMADAILSLTDAGGKSMSGWPLSFASAGKYAVFRGVAVTAKDDVYAVGDVMGSIVFGGPSLIGNNNDLNAFLVKFDATGAHKFSMGFGDGQTQRAYSVCLDSAENVYMTGEAGGGVDFGGGQLIAKGGADIFVAKYDKDGKPLWSKLFGDGTDQIGRGIAATPDGDVVITGEMKGSVDFGGGGLNANGGGFDVFVARLKGADGSQVWSKNFGDGGDQFGSSVAVDSKGNIGLTGNFKSSIQFGGNTALTATGGAPDVFVARLASDGTPTWSQGFGDMNEQFGQSVAMDGAGNLVVAGYFKGTFSIGATSIANVDPANKMFDLFIAKFAGASGGIGWAHRYGDMADQRAWAVATDVVGDAIVAGGFQGMLDFGAPVGVLTSMGATDGFVVKVGP